MIAAVISSNLRLAAAPGNVQLAARESGLPKDSVVNVSQLITVDKSFLSECIGHVSGGTMQAIEDGMRLVLEL